MAGRDRARPSVARRQARPRRCWLERGSAVGVTFVTLS
jgi:hypothetical protein